MKIIVNLIAAIGFILMFGNISGKFTTFSYAGSIVLIIAGLIAKFGIPAKK